MTHAERTALGFHQSFTAFVGKFFHIHKNPDLLSLQKLFSLSCKSKNRANFFVTPFLRPYCAKLSRDCATDTHKLCQIGASNVILGATKKPSVKNRRLLKSFFSAGEVRACDASWEAQACDVFWAPEQV
jgi:hypothetical protein